MFNKNLEEQRKKLFSQFSADQKRYLSFAIIAIFLFLNFLYFGPPDDLKQFGLLAFKKIGQLTGAQQQAGLEPELGTLSGPVVLGNDSSASGGQYVEFTASPAGNFQPASPYYATFYYQWYKNPKTDGSWSYWPDHGNNPPNTWFSHYLPDPNPAAFDPANELYSVNDYNNFKWEVAKMAEAKQEVAIASWFGVGTKQDITFNNIVNSFMARTDNPYSNLRWTIYYENEGFGDPSTATIVSDLTYIRDKFTSSPYYLKINTKPVIFVYGDLETGTTAQRWKDANTQMGNAFYVVLKVYPGYSTDPNQPDSWHQYAPSNRIQTHAPYSMFVSPGFWKDDGSAERLPRSPADFENAVKQMVGANVTWKLTETWNEWGEGSSVEPGEQVILNSSTAKDEPDPSGYQFKNLYIDILSRNLPPLEQGAGSNP